MTVVLSAVPTFPPTEAQVPATPNQSQAYIFCMGRQLSHLLGTTGMLLTVLLWLSLLDVRMADRLFDKLVGSQNEYKLVFGTAFLATAFEFAAVIAGTKGWYVGVALSLGTPVFFTYALSA